MCVCVCSCVCGKWALNITHTIVHKQIAYEHSREPLMASIYIKIYSEMIVCWSQHTLTLTIVDIYVRLLFRFLTLFRLLSFICLFGRWMLNHGNVARFWLYVAVASAALLTLHFNNQNDNSNNSKWNFLVGSVVAHVHYSKLQAIVHYAFSFLCEWERAFIFDCVCVCMYMYGMRFICMRQISCPKYNCSHKMCLRRLYIWF